MKKLYLLFVALLAMMLAAADRRTGADGSAGADSGTDRGAGKRSRLIRRRLG